MTEPSTLPPPGTAVPAVPAAPAAPPASAPATDGASCGIPPKGDGMRVSTPGILLGLLAFLVTNALTPAEAVGGRMVILALASAAAGVGYFVGQKIFGMG